MAQIVRFSCSTRKGARIGTVVYKGDEATAQVVASGVKAAMSLLDTTGNIDQGGLRPPAWLVEDVPEGQ